MNRYMLTKVSIAEGKSSLVRPGETVCGELFKVTEYAKPNEPITPEELQEGDEVFVARGLKDWIKTSPIKRIDKTAQGDWIIETNTSVYELERKQK